MKKLLAFVLAGAMAVSLVACGSAPSTSEDASSSAPSSTAVSSSEDTAESTPAEDAATTIVDLLGNEVPAPTSTDKIVSLAPSFTEIVVDLGLGDHLIAVDAYSSTLPGVPADLPVFDMMNLDVEALAALESDIIFTSDLSFGGGDDPLAPLVELGVCVIGAPAASSFAEIYDYVAFMGTCLDKEAEAAALVDAAKAEVAAVAEIAATIPEEEKKSVFFEISAVPYLYSCGTGVYLNEMIETIGATNVLADQEGWMSVEEEAAVQANPDCILTNVNYVEDSVGEIMARVGWENVTAVANGDVAYINNTASSNGNHTFTVAMWEMAKAVYPEYYA